MDEMTYNYGYGSNNQLSHVDDAISAGTYPADIDDQANSNYTYDASGNLIGDVSEGITNEWTTAGKLQRVTKTGMVIEFRYDAMGNRVSKNVTDNTDSVTTYYVRDAQGNVMAVYQYANNAAELRLQELHLYGSSRVGIRQEDELIWCQSCTLSLPPVTSAWAGRQIYELTNHLGNVLTTVSDKKVHFDNNNDNIADWSVPEIVSQNDYYPFGMLQPGRNFNSGYYRSGFNAMEKDDEIKGLGKSYDFGARVYDPRLGKFSSTDPKFRKFPNMSPYSFAGNMPISAIDLIGEEVYIISSNGQFYKAGEVLLKTADGKALYEKYAKNSQEDIYVSTTPFSSQVGAVGFTIADAQGIIQKGKVLTNRVDNTYRKEVDAAFNDKKIDFSKSGGKKIHLIVIDEKYLLRPETNPYVAAEVIYHEAKAHVEDRTGSADEDHTKYGKTYEGFYKEKTILDAHGNQIRDDSDPTGVLTDRVPDGSPADRIMQQLQQVKDDDQKKE